MMVHSIYRMLLLCWLLSAFCKSSELSCYNGPGNCIIVEKTNSKPGKRLLGFTFRNETAGPQITCIDRCATSCQCVSVNKKQLDDGHELCELNFEDENSGAVSLQDGTGYEYMELKIAGISCKDKAQCDNNCCLQAPCQNGGICTEVCDHSKYRVNCVCPTNFVGRFCQAVAKDCAEHYKQGRKESGVYTINPDGLGEFEVYCDQETSGGGWAIFQRRLDGSVNFFREWNDYKVGFGDVTGEYWLGLEKINRLTRRSSYRLRVDLQDTTEDWTYAEYEDFSVSDEEENYKLLIGNYEGTAGDSLVIHNNHPFSTKDRDNDNNPGSCAQVHKGAWWYTSCHNSNLNGIYYNGPHPSSADGVNWLTWKGHNYSLKRTEMKVRPMIY